MEVEGIPEGWELVRIGSVKPGEIRVDENGKPAEWSSSFESISANCVIIRKIEKPKQYRQFANAAEADSMWSAVLTFKNPAPELENSKFRVNFITMSTVGIGNGSYSYKSAFESFECIDGTPFGVEVKE